MVITDLAQFELLVQEVRDQILSESQGVGEVDIVDNLDNIYSLPALKLNDSGDQVVEAPLSLLSAPAEEAAALARAAAYDANTAAKSANSAASSANLATDKTNEAISNAQSATQQAESSADKANTAAQNADEATAQVLSGESERVEAENARQAAETERQSAEEERKSAEEARKLAEQSRELAESSRVSAEESRVTAESERVTAESSRAQAETERVLKESERESAESTRQLNETTRQSNEDTRVQLEQTRQTNEEQRVSAESSRETEYTDLKLRADALIDDNEAAIENANTAAENANAAIANMENTYAKKDEIPDVSEFITTSVDNLVNYYRKSETYNLELINSLIGSITTINFKIVDSLPGTGENNLIYLVPSSKQEENNVKDEYIWVDGSWELIGSTKIDLSNYYTKDEVDSTFALKTELAWDTITGKPVWIGSSKPTYTWSEINGKPTTLAGYGITDAVTIGTAQTITGIKTFSKQIQFDGVSGISLNYDVDTSRALSIAVTKNTSGSITSSIDYHNTEKRLIFNAVGASETYKDALGKYSFIVGNNELKYNTYNILHTGNYTSTLDTRYVKKAGDTMTGSLTIPVGSAGFCLGSEYAGGRIAATNTTMCIQGGDSGKLYITARNDKTLSDFNIKSNKATINSNTIWHAGNDGSGSGLDADLLDGYQGDKYLRSFWTDKPGYDANNTGNNSFVTFTYSINAPQTGVLADLCTVGYGVQFNTAYNRDTPLYYRRHGRSDDGGIGTWQQLARLTDNVASATKLQTPRTIWGQSFDGTEDVTGDIRTTGNIIGTVSSDIQLKTILNTIDYQDKLLSLGDVVEYEYNEIAFDRSNSSTLLHRTYTGLIYLNVKDVLPSMAYEDLDGYGCLNYLSYDYINLIAGALQLTITKLKQLEKRISILEEENINLKLQLSN